MASHKKSRHETQDQKDDKVKENLHQDEQSKEDIALLDEVERMTRQRGWQAAVNSQGSRIDSIRPEIAPLYEFPWSAPKEAPPFLNKPERDEYDEYRSVLAWKVGQPPVQYLAASELQSQKTLARRVCQDLINLSGYRQHVNVEAPDPATAFDFKTPLEAEEATHEYRKRHPPQPRHQQQPQTPLQPPPRPLPQTRPQTTPQPRVLKSAGKRKRENTNVDERGRKRR
ncbi:MAG: hypothetical protein Q9195_005676 [Heterodermia aff. obscurata]